MRFRIGVCLFAAVLAAVPATADEMKLPLPGGDVSIEFARVPTGSYTRGTPDGEAGRGPDESQHPVRITREFWIGKFEVTNRQFRKFRPDHEGEDGLPVANVSWHDAMAFCRWASERTGKSVRLPTEAEWEWAARARATTRFSFGNRDDDLKNHAWYGGNSGGEAHQVGQLYPNRNGMRDVHGNVAEWCFDWYGKYPGWPVFDSQGPPSGQMRVVRGGSFLSEAAGCRAGDRDSKEPDFKSDWLGFRVVWSSAEREMIVPLPGGEEMRFVYVPAGAFVMGSPPEDAHRVEDEVPHEVTLTEGFWMGKYEVTNRQYRVFRPDHVSGNDASEAYNKDDHPAVSISWHDCVEFCKWAARKTGRPMRLPTEAEWEYAARAGTTTRFSFGDDVNELGKYAWYRTNVNGRNRPVGLLRPNPWGLYDIHGNAAEWCADWYGPYPTGPVTDPKGPETGKKRVSREGSGASEHWNCRVADRDMLEPEYKGTGSGLRVVFTSP